MTSPVRWNGVDIVCFDARAVCPSHVNPDFLDQADGEWICNNHPRMYCTVQCVPDGNTTRVNWLGNQCNKVGVCPPYGFTPASFFVSAARHAELDAIQATKEKNEKLVKQLSEGLQSLLPSDGTAVNASMILDKPGVADLPWVYKGVRPLLCFAYSSSEL